ncbi:hypothetical protein Droror1_Dr00001253 [Drosera rotundifolia]
MVCCFHAAISYCSLRCCHGSILIHVLRSGCLKIRKLFPHELPKPSYMEPRTDAFFSLSCPPFCFPHCPNGCLHVPFLDHEQADDHYSFHRRRCRHDHENLNVLVVVMIILVVLSALALCFSVMCVHILRRRRNRRGILIMVAGLDHARDHVDDDHHQGHDDFVVEDEERGGDSMPVEHQVWYMNAMGLQSSVINSIPVCKYQKDDGVFEGTVCAVCLSEFQEGESLRLLPKCNHAFHVSCIDTSLRSHTNCPMCRAPIVAKTHHHPNSQLPPT